MPRSRRCASKSSRCPPDTPPEKEQHQKERTFQPEDLSEFKTRKIYIDVDLKLMGWKFTGPDADVQEEYRVEDMAGMPGQPGFCDYVLFGKDGLPLAVVEAKRTSKDPNIGRKQADFVCGLSGTEIWPPPHDVHHQWL